jgi:hypothetical protein
MYMRDEMEVGEEEVDIMQSVLLKPFLRCIVAVSSSLFDLFNTKKPNKLFHLLLMYDRNPGFFS